jgi:hypothetical protein
MTSIRHGRLITVLVAATAAFSTLAAFTLSASQAATIHSTITIHYDRDSNTFSGAVHSKHDCEGGREVRVVREDLPDDPVIGSTFTTPDGDWGGIEAPGPGVYAAQVLPTSPGGYGQHHPCDGDESQHVRLPRGHHEHHCDNDGKYRCHHHHHHHHHHDHD